MPNLNTPDNDMTSASASAPAWILASLSVAIRDWARTEGERWLYVVKVLLAASLALWLAYRLELDSPATSLTTVLILALPSSGQVLEKAFYRLLGTIIGCTAGFLMTAFVPQQAVLLFGGLACWLAICTSGAALYRNWKSYGFVLAGYSACMIAVPALDRPEAVFTIATTRLIEVSLGILCCAFINDAFFPRHQSARAIQTIQSRYRNFFQFCDDVLAERLSPADLELAQLKFAADIATLESVRASAFFEAHHVRDDTRLLNAFNAAFMSALSTLYGLHRLGRRVRTQSSILVELVPPMFAAMAAALTAAPEPGAFENLHAQLESMTTAARQRIGEQGPDNPHQADFDTLVELLTRFANEMADFQSLYEGFTQRRRLSPRLADPQPYRPKTPPAIVLAAGARAAVVVLLMAALWYELAWSYATSAIVMTAVFSALASSSPNPTGMIGQCLAGFFGALPLAFISVFFVQVNGHGYPMLMLSILPVFAIATYLSATRKFVGIGVGMNLLLSQTVVPANELVVDANYFLNNTMAVILGVGIAWVMFKVILPEHTMGQKEHVASSLWSEALGTCERQLRGLKHAFDNRMRDLLAQLNAAAGPLPDEATHAVVRQALMLLELGHAAINLRIVIAASDPGPLRQALTECITTLGAWLRRPKPQYCRDAIAAIVETKRYLRKIGAHPDAARAAQLKTALTDLHSIHTALLDHLPLDARR